MKSFSQVVALGLFPVVLYVCFNGMVNMKPYPIHSDGIVLVTGASSGIGRHAAEYLANSGFKVYAGVRKQSDFEDIHRINISNLVPLVLDVTSHSSCTSAMHVIKKEVEKSFVPFAALVNNAGISREVVSEFHDLDDAHLVFNTNFFGAVDLTQQALPLLRKNKGRVIMVSSVGALLPDVKRGIYTASKCAMEGFSHSLRRELKAFDMSVSIIQPAAVASAIFASMDKYNQEKGSEDLEKTKFVETLYPSLFSEHHEHQTLQLTEMASDPIVTSRAIHHAISSKYPRTRYLVGNALGIPAWVLGLLAWLMPDRAIDLLI